MREQLRRSTGREQFVGSLERHLRLALEHRRVHHEVQIVGAVERVEVQRPLALYEPPIGLRRQPDSRRSSRDSHRTGRRCGWACAADVPHRAPARAADRPPAAHPRDGPTSPSAWRYRCSDAGMCASRRRWPARRPEPASPRTTRDTGCGLTGRGVPQRPGGHVQQAHRRPVARDVHVVGMLRGKGDAWRRRSRRGRRSARPRRRDPAVGKRAASASISPCSSGRRPGRLGAG